MQILEQQQQLILNRSNQHWRLSHRKTELQNKERQLKRVKEEDKLISPASDSLKDKEELIENDQQTNKQKEIISVEPKETSVEQSIKDQLNVFNEPSISREEEISKEKPISEKEFNKEEEANDKKKNSFLHLPLDSNLVLSPDTILPPPSSPVNPAYSIKQRSRNKRYKIKRRLKNLNAGKNSSDESDQQINQGSSEDEEIYEIDSSVNSSAEEEDELIDMESTDERTTKLYSKSDFEKLISDTSEQDSSHLEIDKDKLEKKDVFDKQMTNLDSNAQISLNNTNNLLTVQHSHSSDRLKSLDSQSSPASPTILSSAASSATLVASPLSKQAPETLENKESFDKDDFNLIDEKNDQNKETVKDKNNNLPSATSKPQSSVSFSDEVIKTYQSSTSRTSTPKHVQQQPQPQPHYFLWNQQQQSTNPFATNIDYQPHHKLSTTSTTSGTSMNYLKVSKNAAKNIGLSGDSQLILDSVHSTPRSSFQADFSTHTTPRSSFQMSETQGMCFKFYFNLILILIFIDFSLVNF